MLRKFCRCGKIIPQSMKRCPECQSKYDKRITLNNREAYKRYKSKRTDSKEQKFYLSKEWIFTRETVKQRDRGLCMLCDSNNKLSFVDNVHHIEELKDNWSKRTSMDNLICLCDRCHYYVHKKYKKSPKDKEAMQQKLRDILSKGRGI